MLSEMTIREFLEKLSSKDPAPGGGSVAALAGALASSLGNMVSNLTIGKKKYKDVEEEIKKVNETLEKYRDTFLEEMEEDARAFSEVIDSLKLPRNTDEEKKIREEKIQESTKKATLIPLKIAKNALEVMELIEILVKIGNKQVLSDAAIAAIMAKSAILGGIYNIKINLPSIKDEEFVSDLEKQIRNMEIEACILEIKILEQIKF
ncbi:MAG TPA: cyclodeaminase/cyclohydrolase family protein [Defluviitoga sp.]|nr:cyclodeaminase/cyclohydrolase family protein [Defluviitoga sp.]HOP23721.1 cyclodeaminase/cyclohydrolase family protein [Defluviitoga sp.]HPZ28949.1 cyclodeaminase/cyclohydrolase family protein [Defluviitoga sp.]HQD62994.1 cyclodeaminase/cyclohydrolase family protein [Defluviitoga sp.]